jgi:hypothetical protein
LLPFAGFGRPEQDNQRNQAPIDVDAYVLLDELVAPDDYPYCQNSRKQDRKPPDKIRSETALNFNIPLKNRPQRLVSTGTATGTVPCAGDANLSYGQPAVNKKPH